ncbi:DUF779 domain-containing protein [Nocardia cyriacigeorgica]|uniref:DUF779 domain-containing protein n=1 Tax=Nocardia cyriacigeorgica TaxID=135487 RepID=UPI001486AEAB|nr:DUF779 domain-containing protein [Nocardia cyriacigeorgica]
MLVRTRIRDRHELRRGPRTLMPDRSVRGDATEAARSVLRHVIDQHGPVVLMLSPGATAPICLRARDFRPDEGDVLVARLPWHTEFWMSGDNYARYARDHLTIDVGPDPGDAAASASLEIAEGHRFVLRVRPLDANEAAAAAAAPPPRTGADRLR